MIRRAEKAHNRLLNATAAFPKREGYLRIDKENLLVFLSHANLDKKIAVMISRELEQAGVEVWRDDKDMLPGDSIPQSIGQGLARASHFILLHTRNSANSRWVQTETENALMLERKQGRPRIIPVIEPNVPPPPILNHLKWVPLDDLNEMLRELLRGVDIPRPSVDFFQARYLLSRLQRLTESTARFCELDPESHLYLDAFEELAELEHYIQQQPLPPEFNTSKRFVSTGFLINDDKIEPSIPDNFYCGFTNAIASAAVLSQYVALAEKWAAFLEKADT